MTAFVGRDVLVEYAIAPTDANPAALVRLRLGMMRGKDLETSWDETDTTGDMSPQYTKTSLSTFRQVKFSGDGVAYDDAIFNQLPLERHVLHPGAATNNQPIAWLWITYPNKMYVGPFNIPKFANSAPHDGAVTWKIEASSNGAVELVAI